MYQRIEGGIFLTNETLYRILLGVVLVLAAVAAGLHYFVEDDAFISFRYAKNFAEGNGLVWYHDLREFGFTNFIFTVAVALLSYIGLNPETAAFILTFPAFLASVMLTVQLSLMVGSSKKVALITGLVVGTHYTISSYASSGMETAVQMMLVLATYVQIFRYTEGKHHVSPWGIGASAALALLCRLDSALLLFYAYLYLLAYHFRQWRMQGNAYVGQRTVWLPSAVMVLVPIGAVAAMMGWSYWYYGSALPNTYYAKFGVVGEFISEGLQYGYSYLQAECFFPLVLLALTCVTCLEAAIRKLAVNPKVLYLIGACFLWWIYIISIGGDFMEFRLLVPMLPLFYVGCFGMIETVLDHRKVRFWCAMAVVCVGVNIAHGFVFEYGNILVDSVKRLNGLVRKDEPNWTVTGTSLRKLFYTGGPDDVVLALHPVGAIPYYSGLVTVDEFGLNDRWVALYGVPGRIMAGHRRRAPFNYMVDRGVNLLIDFPKYYCPDTSTMVPKRYYWVPLIMIPLDGGCYLLANYLKPHEKVDRLIAEGKIRRIPPDAAKSEDGDYYTIGIPPFN